MTFTHVRRWRFASVILALGLLTSSTVGVARADSTTFSGQATVVKATVLGNTVVLADTGPLPASGGSQEASLLTASVPGTLTAEVLHASTVGQGDRSRSEASVASLSLTAGNNTVSADFLMSRAMAVCGPGGASASGSSEIVGLAVNNQPISVSGQPNQTIALPDGTGQIVINQQSSSRAGDITVNALHVTTLAGTDVVISSAHADITCPPPGQVTCTGGDFVTGGGWITVPGGKANFAVAGGIKNGAFWGHLQYIDHGSGTQVKGTGVTAYFNPPNSTPTTRHIEGTADINGTSGTYKVDVADNGEPGVGTDTFTITLSTGYTAGGTLSGGNIQLHKPCQ
jgi:hypothetical protein